MDIMFYSVCANYLFLHLSYTLGRVVTKVAIYIIGDFLRDMVRNESPLSRLPMRLREFSIY